MKRLGRFSGGKLAALAALAFVLLAVVGLVPAQHAVGQSAEWVEHTYQVIARAEALLADLRDAEASQRSFLLTHESVYLEPYDEARQRAQAGVHDLRRLVLDNPRQTARLPAIEGLVADRLEELAQGIALAERGEVGAARPPLASAESKRRTDRIRAEVGAFVDEERRLLVERRSTLEAAERTALTATVLAALCGAAAAGASAHLQFRRGRRSEALMRNAVDNMAEGFALLDRDFRIIEINREGLRLDPRPRSALAGKTHWDVYPGTEHSELGRLCRQAATERRPISLEHRYEWEDGRTTWLEVRAYPVPGDVLAIFYRDVTDRKLAEHHLRSERERYAAAFDNAAVGMAEVGLDGRWLRVNATLCDILGYTGEELLALTFQAVTHPDDLEAELHLLQRLIEGEIPSYSIEKRCVRQNGSLVPINLTVGLVQDAEGRPLYLISVIEDISARRAAEDEVRRLNLSLERQVKERTADLETANRQLEAFTYTVSHDLRAPLRGMEGFARILLDDFGEALGAKGQRYAQRIVAAAERMEGLINDLLTFSRLQRVEVQARIMNPLPIVRAAAEDAVAASLVRGATIDVAASMPDVLAEPAVLVHVIANLLTNAVKFHRPNEPARVRVWAERRDNVVRLWVEDEGIGIAPEHHDRIFGAFERLHGQEAYAGTGIGLAIVKTGAERLGGKVGIVSEAERGARFWVELPAPTTNSADEAHERTQQRCIA